MLVKMNMCPCHSEEYSSLEEKLVKKTQTFKCNCKDAHEYFLNFCEEHPYGSKVSIFNDNNTREYRCFCHKETTDFICRHCTVVKYELNFAITKLCFEDSNVVRNYLRDNGCVSLNEYLSCYPI